MSSIRQVFPIVLSIQITVAVGITGWISFSSSEKTIKKLTTQLCDNLNYRVEQQIGSYLNRSIQGNQALSFALTKGNLDPNNISQVQSYIFNKSQELQINNIIFFGNQNGSMVGVDRLADSTLLLRIRDNTTAPNRPTYELNERGERGRLVMNELLYDHRDRPWYKAAKETGTSVWTSVFVSTTDGELTTTKATPIYDDQGTFQGVAGVNISLKQINQFMQEIRPSDKWHLFLVEADGKLVGSTAEEPVFTKDGQNIQRFSAAQSQNPRLQKVGQLVQEKFGGFPNLEDSQILEFESNGETYFVSTHKLDNQSQPDWSVGVIVPKSVFMAEIDANNRLTIGIIVIMLGVNIVIGLAIAAWLLRPIKELMNAAKEIEEETFNPDALQSVATRQDELGQMARVFQEMGSTVAERQQGMLSQLHKLRAEKDEAKKAAIASQMGKNNSLQLILQRSRAVREKR